MAACNQNGKSIHFLTDQERTPPVCAAALRQSSGAAAKYMTPEQCESGKAVATPAQAPAAEVVALETPDQTKSEDKSDQRTQQSEASRASAQAVAAAIAERAAARQAELAKSNEQGLGV